MRFLYHLDHGAQLFEEDGQDHAASGWHDHPEKAGLVAVLDPNNDTKWVAPAVRAPAPPPAPVAAAPVASVEPVAEPLWVPIPEGWADLHWTQQVKLANEIQALEVPAITTKPEAVDVIEAELARRAS